jgi:hypothetical protein
LLNKQDYKIFFNFIALHANNIIMAQEIWLYFRKELFFEGKNRVQQINLANTVKDTLQYNTFVEFRMTSWVI